MLYYSYQGGRRRSQSCEATAVATCRDSCSAACPRAVASGRSLVIATCSVQDMKLGDVSLSGRLE